MRVVVHESELERLKSDPRVLAGVGGIAHAVALDMRRRAPKKTGAGAESIHSVPAEEASDGFRVSWDKDHFYMSFQEYGTERMAARPFARPTADEFNRR